MALDAKLRLKEARKARYAQYDAKRKGLVEELEERERAFKKARTETEAQKKERWRENERIMEEGRRLREEREKELERRERERQELEKKTQTGSPGLEPPSLGPYMRGLTSKDLHAHGLRATGALDTTVRVKYTLSSHPSLTTVESIAALLAPFGSVDDSSIVLSLKPSPPKKPKRGTALVPFKQIVGAFAAVCASGRPENGLGEIEVDWAEGKEPELIGWLKKMGKLGSGSGSAQADSTRAPSTPAQQTPLSADYKPAASGVQAPASTDFSSFPSTFVSVCPYWQFTDSPNHCVSQPDLDNLPKAPSATTDVPGLDYESLTLMRMRQAERERLEREIREREAQEE